MEEDTYCCEMLGKKVYFMNLSWVLCCLLLLSGADGNTFGLSCDCCGS